MILLNINHLFAHSLKYCGPISACRAASHLLVEVPGGSAFPDFRVHVVVFDTRKSWGRADSDFSWFWLGRKTANFTGAVSWSTTSVSQERSLTIVNNIYSLYKDFKKVMYKKNNNNNNKGF